MARKGLTSITGRFDVSVNAQNVQEIVQFRAVSVWLGIVRKQLDRIRDILQISDIKVRQEVLQAALQLRGIHVETAILDRCLLALEGERDQLAQDERVAVHTKKSI